MKWILAFVVVACYFDSSFAAIFLRIPSAPETICSASIFDPGAKFDHLILATAQHCIADVNPQERVEFLFEAKTQLVEEYVLPTWVPEGINSSVTETLRYNGIFGPMALIEGRAGSPALLDLRILSHRGGSRGVAGSDGELKMTYVGSQFERLPEMDLAYVLVQRVVDGTRLVAPDLETSLATFTQWPILQLPRYPEDFLKKMPPHDQVVEIAGYPHGALNKMGCRYRGLGLTGIHISMERHNLVRLVEPRIRALPMAALACENATVKFKYLDGTSGALSGSDIKGASGGSVQRGGKFLGVVTQGSRVRGWTGKIGQDTSIWGEAYGERLVYFFPITKDQIENRQGRPFIKYTQPANSRVNQPDLKVFLPSKERVSMLRSEFEESLPIGALRMDFDAEGKVAFVAESFGIDFDLRNSWDRRRSYEMVRFYQDGLLREIRAYDHLSLTQIGADGTIDFGPEHIIQADYRFDPLLNNRCLYPILHRIYYRNSRLGTLAVRVRLNHPKLLDSGDLLYKLRKSVTNWNPGLVHSPLLDRLVVFNPENHGMFSSTDFLRPEKKGKFDSEGDLIETYEPQNFLQQSKLGLKLSLTLQTINETFPWPYAPCDSKN